LLWFFGDGNPMNNLPGLALNHDPSDLRLPSRQHYSCEPPTPSFTEEKS
jgi:hypothetical protein